MPKKSLKINQFHGGLNNYRDKRDTPDNALANATNIMVDIPGKIRMMGRDIKSALSTAVNESTGETLNGGVIDGLTTPGYGLFAFSADHALDGTDTQSSEFIVYQSQTDFNIVYDDVIYKLAGTDPYVDGGITTTGWTGSPRPDFLYNNERLFISDGDFSNVSSGDSQVPHVFEFLNNTLFSSGNSIALAAAGWYTNKASYPKPTDGNISAVDDTSVQVAAFTDQHIKITVENDNDGEGQWENQNIWLGISQLYGDEESRINTTGLAVAALAQGQGSLDLGFSISINTTSPLIDKRTTGYKIYVLALNTGATPKYYKDPFLLATADMVNEELISHEGISVALDYNATSVDIKRYDSDAMLGIATLPTTTFEIENLYAHDVETIRAKWKTSTQIGNALYIGNVRTLDDAGNEVEVNPDKILRGIAPPNTKRMGIFPSSDFLDVTVGDGDEIVALESFADKLLVFKKKTLFVINVSGDIEYIELERKFVGIENPYNVTKTELGIAWVTEQGAFLYDGEKILNLIDGKLDPYIESLDGDTGFAMPGWTTFIGNTGGGQVAYIPPLKQLVVLDSPINPGNQGNFFIYDFRTTSWTYAVGKIDNSPRSSMISGFDKSFLWLGSISAPGNSTSSFIANIGSPALDYKARITGLSDQMTTSGNTTYQLMVNSNTALTPPFTYSGIQSGKTFAQAIVDEILDTDNGTGYTDPTNTDSIEAIAISSTNSSDEDIVEITFSGVGADPSIPTIFGEDLEWNTLDGNEVPSITLASFLQSGIGHSVAPVRGWYHGPSMSNLDNHIWGDHGSSPNHLSWTDDDGIYRGGHASWGGNTWGGSRPFNGPHFYGPSGLLENPSGWYTPFFAGQNMIYPWILNHLRMFIGEDAREGKVNGYELYNQNGWSFSDQGSDVHYGGFGSFASNATHFDDIGWLSGFITTPIGTTLSQPSTEVIDSNGSTRKIGSPWGYRGFHPSHYNDHLTSNWENDTHLHHSDILSGFDPQVEYSKRNAESDLYSYTGMVIMPGAAATGRQSLFHWDLTNENHALGGSVETDIRTTDPLVRANPRLIRYMCDFPENTKLSEGDDFILPNDTNKGNYVSPGLIYTQAWTEGDDDSYIDTIKDRSPYGNGHYTEDAKSQSNTPYPNGYHFFGFGHGEHGEIIEAIGGPIPPLGEGFITSTIKDNDNPGENENLGVAQNGLFAGGYFIGRKIRWNHLLANQEDSIAYRSHKSIAEDIFEPEKFRLFKNFGDMSFVGNGSWDRNHSRAIDGSTEFPSTLLRSGIPFNQQSIIGLGDCRENPITRDAAYFTDGNPNIISSAMHNMVHKDKLSGYPGFEDIGPSGFNITKDGYKRAGQSNPPYVEQGWLNYDLESPGGQIYWGEQGNIGSGLPNNHPNWDSDLGQFAYYGDNQPICYTSMPYLVIEVQGVDQVNKIILHMICDPTNNSGHKIGNIYNYTIEEASDYRNYSLSNLKLTGGEIIDLNEETRFEFRENQPAENMAWGFDTIAPVDSRTWGLNGYLKLEFNYAAQTPDVKTQIDNSGMSDYGTAAFWANPLKDGTDHGAGPTEAEATTEGSPNIENTKDPIALDYDYNYLHGTSIISGVPPSLSSFNTSYSPFFQLLSNGQKGSKREVILHASKGHSKDSADKIALSATISKGSKNVSVVNAGLQWDNETADACDSIYKVISSDDGNSILEKLETTEPELYESVANVKRTKRIVATNTGDPGQITIEGDERGYFREGNAIWFDTLVPTPGDLYLISYIDYDITHTDKTTITFNTNSPPTHAATISGANVYKSTLSSDDIAYLDDGASVDKIIYGTGLHFVGHQDRFINNPNLDVSGSFSGELQVLTFKNSSQWVENTSNTNAGTFLLETKDFDFGNPASLKNINYIDISMKGVAPNVKVKYAINNERGSSAWRGFPDHAISDDFQTYRYKLSTGSIKNINSIRLKIYDKGDGNNLPTIKSFEINDITIVYREKQL